MSPQRFDKAVDIPQKLLEAAKRYPDAVIRQNADGEWLLYPHGTMMTAMMDAVAELDRNPPRQAWPALRGLAVVAYNFLRAVKWLIVWILTVAFLIEVLTLDYLRDLGGADPNRVDHAKRVRISGTRAKAAEIRGIGAWPALILFVVGFPISLGLHLAAVSWLFGGTIFLP